MLTKEHSVWLLTPNSLFFRNWVRRNMKPSKTACISSFCVLCLFIELLWTLAQLCFLQPVYTIHLCGRDTPCSKESIYRDFGIMERRDWSTYTFFYFCTEYQSICFKVFWALTANLDRKCLICTELLEKKSMVFFAYHRFNYRINLKEVCA